jgi:hypothetical protein
MARDWVTPRKVAAEADEAVGTTLPDFQAVKSGCYVRSDSADVIQMVQLKAWKGELYTIAWGVSLSFVPDRLALPLRFHRTLKSARLDLWDDSLARAERHGTARDDAVVSALDGEEAVHRGLQAVWQSVEPHARSLWMSARSLEGMLSLADVIAADADSDIRHPPTHVVAALVCARMGRQAEAMHRLSPLGLDADEQEAVVHAIRQATPPED